MTNEQAMHMLKAKLECLKRETSGTDFDCNQRNCDECPLCYEQGHMGEQQEALDLAIKALEQEPCEDAIRRADAEALFRNARSKLNPSDYKTADEFNTRDLMLLNAEQFIHGLPSVRPQEPKTGLNNHQIACMLADLFGDVCACNYNGIDEWLGELCDFKDTCCPNPVGVACWEQFLKYSQSRYTECGLCTKDVAKEEPAIDEVIAEINKQE